MELLLSGWQTSTDSDLQCFRLFYKRLLGQKGNQKVADGEGEYEFSIPFEGYTTFGYDFYLNKGKVKSGRPYGTWDVYFFNIGQKPIYGFSQRYVNGNVVKIFDEEGEVDKEDFDIFQPIPYDYFVQAESLNSKSCNFDDYSNFYKYLAETFGKALAPLTVELNEQGNFNYTVSINSSGWAQTRSLTYVSDIEINEINNALKKEARNIDFYFPTQKENGAISDKINVSGKIDQDTTGRLFVHTIKIEREINNSSK